MASGSPSARLDSDDRNVWVSDILRGGVTRLTDDGRSEVPPLDTGRKAHRVHVVAGNRY